MTGKRRGRPKKPVGDAALVEAAIIQIAEALAEIQARRDYARLNPDARSLKKPENQD
jgi:hypothetical protein